MSTLRTLRDLHRWASAAPAGATLPAASLAEALAGLLAGEVEQPTPPAPDRPDDRLSWRVLLWTVAAETRMGPDEVAEAFGRSRSWVYKRTGPKAHPRLPHRKLDGLLTFTAGELRAWVREHEESVLEGESWTPPILRGSRAARLAG